MPETVDNINLDGFSGCTKLTAINVNAGNSVNDFRLFEENVTKKILALNLKET